MTDTTWRCSAEPLAGTNWMDINYSDLGWDYASEIEENVGDLHPKLTMISASASWIWTDNVGGDTIVFCRGRIGSE